MTPKDWSTQEEAIAAAKAEILAAIGSTDARLELGMVKSIQRGSAEAGTSVTISEVKPEKAICISGFSNSHGAASGGTLFIGGYANLINSTTVSINGTSGVGTSKNYISWQVIEFY